MVSFWLCLFKKAYISFDFLIHGCWCHLMQKSYLVICYCALCSLVEKHMVMLSSLAMESKVIRTWNLWVLYVSYLNSITTGVENDLSSFLVTAYMCTLFSFPAMALYFSCCSLNIILPYRIFKCFSSIMLIKMACKILSFDSGKLL